MLPIGVLMIEHRLIERMVSLLEFRSARDKSVIDEEFMLQAIDFFKFYVDLFHHGKEEEFLFSPLKQKNLSQAQRSMLEELIEEHQSARKLVAKMEADLKGQGANNGDIKKFIRLYRGHIGKEDKQFFLPVMEYFDQTQKDNMIREFQEFDKKMFHERYKLMIENLEKVNNIKPSA